MENQQNVREQNIREISSEAQRLFDDAQERASEFYEMSLDFIRENQTAVLIGSGVLVGILGFFLGRASKSD